jgi:hypothetical protein
MRALLQTAIAVLGLATSAPAIPIGSSFTYQGELTDAGVPVAGAADFQFTLYDAELGGAIVGSMVQLDAVAVANGRLTAQLDFGDSFDGDARWLEIRVRSPHDPTDTQPFSILNPRQPLTATPYALRAANGGWIESGAGIRNETTGFVGVNRGSPVGLEWFGVHAPVTVGYGGMYITTEGGAAKPFYGYNTGTESGWTYLDGVDGDWHLNLNNLDRLTVTDAGDVGIGNTSPTTKLDVNGLIRSAAGGFRFPDGTTQTTAASSSGGNTLNDAYNEGGPGFGRAITTNAGAVAITGVGGLDLSGGAPAAPLLAVNQTSTGNIAVFRESGADLVTIQNDGDVGIGTNPQYTLDVRESSTTANAVHFERPGIAVSGSDLLELSTADSSSASAQFIEAQTLSDIKFRVWGDGDVTADGTLTGGGADFAEAVKVTRGAHTVEAGDVIVIDPNARRGFSKSDAARSRLVAGVYSTKPGVLASEHDWDQVAIEVGLSRRVAEGEEAEAVKPLDVARRIDEVPLAVVGIVPCKVSAENGPIRAGDLLVTASTPGHAMRDDDPKPGTIVGKALDALASGTGVVTVLVTLQ